MKKQEKFERLASLHDHFTDLVWYGRSLDRGDLEGAPARQRLETKLPNDVARIHANCATEIGKAYHEGFTEGVMAALRLALGVAYGDQEEAAFALEQFPDLDT